METDNIVDQESGYDNIGELVYQFLGVFQNEAYSFEPISVMF